MKKLLKKLRIAGLACVLTAGLGVGATAATTVLTAGPASAANGPCWDVTNANPTPLHQYPSAGSKTAKFLPPGYTVTGDCIFWDNPSESRWYMEVNYIGPGNNGGYGYIWVQRLVHGSSHECVDGSTVHGIGSGTCPLLPY